MQFSYFSLTTFLLFASAFGVSARTVSLSTEDAGRYVLQHNPTLAAVRLRIEEARGRLQQAGRYSNPELSSEFNQSFRSPERSMEVAFTQRFPLTGRLRLEKAVSRAELAAAEAEVRDEERKLVAAVRAGLVRMHGIELQRALREAQLAASREIAEFTRKRVETAESAIVDATQAELEFRQLETELLQLQTERVTLLGELRPMLGLQPNDELQLRGGLPAPAGALAATPSVENRPDLTAARANVTAAQSAAALARAQKWQDLSVGIAVQSEYVKDAPEGFERDEFVGFRFSLPLPLWDDNSGRVREADAAAVRRAKEVDALKLNIRSEADAARGEMATLAKLVQTMDAELLPAAVQIEEQLRIGQAAGQVTLIEVLRARSRRLQLERQRLDALRDYHLARVRFETATGGNIGVKTRRSSKK